ncbi:MAG TPA: hypothetical protein V6D25_17020 [Leptolyngbyaceae cyanobacterium]
MTVDWGEMWFSLPTERSANGDANASYRFHGVEGAGAGENN